MYKWLIGLGILLLGMQACREDARNFSTQVDLRFSSDTIFLDTVFTTIGSSTRLLKVYNPSNEPVRIQNIRLGRGSASYFRMNVNGTATRSINDVELLEKDSLYIFVAVTADVMGALELLYTDSIVFTTSGRVQDVDLVTLAKDAHFHLPTAVISNLGIAYGVLPCNEVWTNDKPHVIYGYAVIDSACTLTIQPGAEIHFHNNSGLWVYRGGSLQVDPQNVGSASDPITFQGDRLEPFYEDIPGQWGGVLGGIFFQGGSVNNLINNAEIKNATTAIRIDSNGTGTSNVELKNTFVLNSSRVGVYGGFGHVKAENLVVANSGLYSLYCLGGNYQFLHCTFANYWNGSRSVPTIGLFNFFEAPDQSIRIRPLESAYFGNCIVWGSSTTEVAFGKEPGTYNYLFKNCLMRLDPNPQPPAYDLTNPTHFEALVLNQDPQFEDYVNNLYALDTLSAAMDIGNTTDAALVPLDITGTPRNFNGLPDAGAYERIE